MVWRRKSIDRPDDLPEMNRADYTAVIMEKASSLCDLLFFPRLVLAM